MKFKIDDCFEVAGKERFKVIFADEEKFIAANVHYSPGIGNLISPQVKMYSNKEEDWENMYWVKKIEAIDCPYTKFERL